jgi:hypothetical protein
LSFSPFYPVGHQLADVVIHVVGHASVDLHAAGIEGFFPRPTESIPVGTFQSSRLPYEF